jgi:hypothetical protein
MAVLDHGEYCRTCGALPGEFCKDDSAPHPRNGSFEPFKVLRARVTARLPFSDEREVDTSLLTTAADVIADRQAKYGSPLEDMRRIAQMWSAILGVAVKPEQVPLCMEAVKISRAVNAYQPDNAVDGCGYWQVYESCMTEQFAEDDQRDAAKVIAEAQ